MTSTNWSPARVSLLRTQGDRAYSLGSTSAAREFYVSARELWPEDSPEWARLVVRYRRPTLFHRFEHEELLRARDALVADGDVEGAAEAELYLGWDAWNEGRGKDASVHHEKVVDLADRLPASHTKAYLLGSVAIQRRLRTGSRRASKQRQPASRSGSSSTWPTSGHTP